MNSYGSNNKTNLKTFNYCQAYYWIWLCDLGSSDRRASKQLESVQRRFLGIVKFNYNITCEPHDYTSVFRFLHISALSDRRYRHNLSFLRKLLSGSIDCPALLALINIKLHIRNIRNNSNFLIPHYQPIILKMYHFLGWWKSPLRICHSPCKLFFFYYCLCVFLLNVIYLNLLLCIYSKHAFVYIRFRPILLLNKYIN